MKKIILIVLPLLLLAGCTSKTKDATSHFAQQSQSSAQSTSKTSSVLKPSSSDDSATASSTFESSQTSALPSSWDSLSLNQQIALLIQKGGKNFDAPVNNISWDEVYHQSLSHVWAMSGTIDNGSILIPTMASNDPYRVSTRDNIVTIEAGNAKVSKIVVSREDLVNEFYGDRSAQEKTDALASKIVSVERLNEIINEKFSNQ